MTTKRSQAKYVKKPFENTVYRYKAIIGPAMQSRTLQGQRVEAKVGCRILNTMTTLGMPESHQVG